MKKDEEDLTSFLVGFRSACVTIWNEFIRDLEDSEINFIEIERGLLGAYVLVLARKYSEEVLTPGFRHFPWLELRSQKLGKIQVIRLRREKDVNRSIYVEWEADDATACFSSLFDWDRVDGVIRHFEFVAAVVVDSRSSTFEKGDVLLVPFDLARVVDVAPKK